MNILETIVAEKREEAQKLGKVSLSRSALAQAMVSRGDKRDFLAALRNPKVGRVALIAEVKKASPSAGVICADFDPRADREAV
jgi:indole-3-glycerol phosphate synthase